MTNKLVVIINSLKVPKIKKILLYKMKFLVPIYSCLQNLRLVGYRPQIPVLCILCPQLNLLNPPKQSSWVCHWTRLHPYAGSVTARKQILNKNVFWNVTLYSLVNWYQGFGGFEVTEMTMRAAVLSRTIIYLPYYFEFKVLLFYIFLN